MAQDNRFEIPKQLRELAEKNVEQARAAYGEYMETMAQAVSAWTKVPTSAMTSGLRDVQQLAIRFAKENAEAAFSLGSDLANAKDLQDVLRLQSRYAQAQMQSYARQAQELGRVMGEAGQSVRPREAPPEAHEN